MLNLKLQKTEKCHWVNGYQERGGGTFKTINLSIFNIGIMFSWGALLNNKIKVNLFKLTPIKKTYFSK